MLNIKSGDKLNYALANSDIDAAAKVLSDSKAAPVDRIVKRSIIAHRLKRLDAGGKCLTDLFIIHRVSGDIHGKFKAHCDDS